MTVVVTIPSQQYTPRTINASPSIPANTRSIVVSCTREAWPAGPVGSISVTFPDGSLGPSVSFVGGVALNKDGSTATVSSMTLELQQPNGQPVSLPVGTYGVQVQVLQTITTAVTVERF